MSAPTADVAVGDVLSIRATKWVQQGFCLGHLESGLPVFIHGALPGEELRVRISRVRQGHAFAVVEEVLTPSADRQANDCSAFPYCGGCSFRQISYDAEFELKLQLLGELPHLQQAIDQAKATDRFRTHRGKPDGYRIRARLHQATSNSRPGFYALHSNAIVPFPEGPGCRQLANELNEHFAGEFAGNVGGDDASATMAFDAQAAYTAAASEPGEQSGTGDAGHQGPAKGQHHRGKAKGPRKTGSRHRALQLELDDPPTVGEEPWRIPEGAFFQSNQFLWSDWLEAAQRMLSELNLKQRPKTMELFCGSGLLGGALRDMLGSYSGFDNAREGLKAAEQNFSARGFSGRFHSFDLYRKPVAVSRGARLAIVNPPRAGMNRRQIPVLAAGGIQHVLYSSCNPQTLNRDIERLAVAGYAPRSVEVFDFFPRTPHLEVLILLESKA